MPSLHKRSILIVVVQVLLMLETRNNPVKELGGDPQQSIVTCRASVKQVFPSYANLKLSHTNGSHQSASSASYPLPILNSGATPVISRDLSQRKVSVEHP